MGGVPREVSLMAGLHVVGTPTRWGPMRGGPMWVTHSLGPHASGTHALGSHGWGPINAVGLARDEAAAVEDARGAALMVAELGGWTATCVSCRRV